MSHGSEKRARTTHLTIRFSPEERATVDEAAARAGLTAGSYARQTLFGAPQPRQVRRPPVERRELARLLGQIGRIGGNVNQLARTANRGLPITRREVAEALNDLRAIRDCAFQ